MRSRRSKLAVLLGVAAAFSFAAAPAAVLRHAPEHAESRGDSPALHTAPALVAPVTARAANAASAHRRASSAPRTVLLAAAGGSLARASAFSNSRRSVARWTATRLVARGYDATAPPLS